MGGVAVAFGGGGMVGGGRGGWTFCGLAICCVGGWRGGLCGSGVDWPMVDGWSGCG